MLTTQAFVDRLREEGPVGGEFDTIIALEAGFRAMSNPGRSAMIQRRVAQVADLLERAARSPIGAALLVEAFSTSDFALSFGWFTDYAMLGAYQQTDPVWQAFFRRSVLPDFRAAARDRVQGLDTPMQEVKELQSYKNDSQPNGDRQTLQLAKYGRTFPISFEAIINDVLRQMMDIPRRFARAARNTEQYRVSKSYVANSTLYATNHAVNGGTVSNKGTAKLSIASLQAALSAMMSLTDANGNPIVTGLVRLVVPPQLELTAAALLGATNLIFDTNPSAGTAKTRFETNNFFAPRLKLVVDPYIPIIDPTNGPNSWYLFADPDVLPVGEVAFLKGHEEPELFMRSPDAVRISDAGSIGGLASPMDGDFDRDSVEYKVRHIVGAAAYEWMATYMSDGTT